MPTLIHPYCTFTFHLSLLTLTMRHFTPSQLILSHREYEVLRDAVKDSITDDPRFQHSPIQRAKQAPILENRNAAAFRAATRVYLGTNYGLKAVQALLSYLTARRNPGKGLTTPQPRKPLVADRRKFALSLALLLFFHRFLYKTFSHARLQLLHEKAKDIRERWPRIYDVLTSKLTPGVAASLSGLALGICPKDQLRVTIAIYILVRAAELVYKGADAAGYLKRKPRWVGSWMLFALTQGQLLHAFVFDSDCFPTALGDFLIKHCPEYIQRRPAGLSQKVAWPSTRQIVDSLAQIAKLKWPSYVSPVLRPKDLTTLPASIDPMIAPITSRAHPALQHLSCALIHPAETSCFTPFLRQILLSMGSVGRFFTMYYGAFSLLRIRRLFKDPLSFFTKLAMQILRVTVVVCGSVAGSWGSICFFNNYLPKSFIPEFRFFLGATISSSIAIIDRSPTGHENAMYTTRLSLDSLWKVGRKRGWWRGVKGGDVGIFVVALAVFSVLWDSQRKVFAKDGSMVLVRLLRGDIEVGLKNRDEDGETRFLEEERVKSA